MQSSSSQIIKQWIIKQLPGLVPEVKSPQQSTEGVYKMLKELQTLYPDANLIVCQLAYGNQLWTESGIAFICEYEAAQAALDGCEHEDYETIHAIDHERDLRVCLFCNKEFITP